MHPENKQTHLRETHNTPIAAQKNMIYLMSTSLSWGMGFPRKPNQMKITGKRSGTIFDLSIHFIYLWQHSPYKIQKAQNRLKTY